MTVQQNTSDAKAEPVEMNLRARSVIGSGPSNTMTGGSGASADWRTVFYMIIHLPNGAVKMNLAKLDTAAAIDILSQEILNRLGIPMEEYYGGNISPLGAPITPLGQVTLDWHIRGYSKTYTTTFAVLDHHSTRGFDALLSSKTIGEIGFYTINDSVWFFE